jgi:methionyl-tRNA synthetase
MKRLFKHFTTDTRPCGCSRHASAPKCDKCTAKRSPTTDTKPSRVSNASSPVMHVDIGAVLRAVRKRLKS